MDKELEKEIDQRQKMFYNEYGVKLSKNDALKSMAWELKNKEYLKNKDKEFKML